jgi:hypothetical protein
MGRVDEYRRELRELEEWDAYLLERSGLPGPRANLELLAAVVEEASEIRLRAYAVNEDEFLAACGVAGFGRVAAQGRPGALEAIRHGAADERWRVREAAAIALQRFADDDLPGMHAVASDWVNGAPYERRAAVAAVAEPRLLVDEGAVRRALEVLDRATASLVAEDDRRRADVRTLRKVLGYAWSVVVAADPAVGLPVLERWADSDDADVRWVIRQNLTKARLQRAAPAWVAQWAAKETRPQ